jgi:glycosyltransferase involved in cell wall biosynthesis/ubiquinone/menaquinone biosynthesis C-methylase UbiE
MTSYLYVGFDLGTAAVITDESLAHTTERHKLPLRVGALTTCLDPLGKAAGLPEVKGIVVSMLRGWPGSTHIRFASRALGKGYRVWFHWPHEEAVECVDRERLTSYWHHWWVIAVFRLRQRLRLRDTFSRRTPELDPGPELAQRAIEALSNLIDSAEPVPFTGLSEVPSPSRKIPGLGIYLRTDYWVNITSGGSYGHTCYVAKELAAVTEQMMCLTASHYPLLDEYGLDQVILPAPSEFSDDVAVMGAVWHYLPLLRMAFRVLRPAYIYERLVLGSFSGAALSRELGIPYILEYNGSEISINRSFGGGGMQYDEIFTKVEDAAFRQATIINVVSQVIKDSLVARGVEAAKILVNPNGADPEVYAPAADDARTEVRRELGFGARDRVVGFTGTFGGWHGIDVLAAAIPQICARVPDVKVLLIGDGSHKALVDDAVVQHQLSDRVKSVGRVPQGEGARLLPACDIFVSPHNSHMIDSKFFGSPTKLFEYMSVGGGIVGSDLEQLGEVLSPALRLTDFAKPDLRVSNERAVLCTPGDVEEFVGAVCALAERPEISRELGRNARQAVIDTYSWRQHVAHVWRFAIEHAGRQLAERELRSGVARVNTGDAYKEEVQNQWNNNPVGSHYAKAARPETLEWFHEVEAYRYGQYAPWMPKVMEFDRHAGHEVLEIGGGLGTDLSQFARHGACVTDLDLSAGHLALAQQNFALRGLQGRFVHQDAEELPFPDASFDLVYSNGVLHHTPNTRRVVGEIYRVLKPGGRAIVMMYAENSYHYWHKLVWILGLNERRLNRYSMAEIMSRHVEITDKIGRPLVKVYTPATLRKLFDQFSDRRIYQRQLIRDELPHFVRKWAPLGVAGRFAGWNIIIKAAKPRT